LDAVVAQDKKEADKLLNTAYQESRNGYEFWELLDDWLDLVRDAEAGPALAKLYLTHPYGAMARQPKKHEIKCYIERNFRQLPHYRSPGNRIGGFLQWLLEKLWKAIAFPFKTAWRVWNTEDQSGFAEVVGTISLAIIFTGGAATILFIIETIIYVFDPPLDVKSARLLKEQGYEEIVLSKQKFKEHCQGTESVAEGVKQEASFPGHNFTAERPNTDEAIEGKVCPGANIVEVDEIMNPAK
ncbi:MAG: hypothetical protein ABEJ25_06640, partial [Candidatus Bipolaricaulia bacterium]